MLADSSTLDPTQLVNFGVLGIIIALAAIGWIWFKPGIDKITEEKDRAIAEREKAEAQRDAMAQVLQEKLLPVVGDFITTTRTLLPILQQIQQLQQMIPILQQLIQGGDYEAPPKQKQQRRQPPAADRGRDRRTDRKGK